MKALGQRVAAPRRAGEHGRAQVALPVEKRGDIGNPSGGQGCRQPTTPGLAEVVYRLSIEGPLGMETKQARVLDAEGAWASAFGVDRTPGRRRRPSPRCWS